MVKQDGGPAYPWPSAESCGYNHVSGMSLRDWFAGMALQGMCASAKDGVHDPGLMELVGSTAYCYANAMLKARGNGDG